MGIEWQWQPWDIISPTQFLLIPHHNTLSNSANSSLSSSTEAFILGDTEKKIEEKIDTRNPSSANLCIPC